MLQKESEEKFYASLSQERVMLGNQTTRLLLDQDMADLSKKYQILNTFKAAADSFVKQIGETTKIWAASQDWFLEEWGRDTFISLSGILLSARRFEEAKEIIRSFSRYEKNGLIPNRIRSDHVEYNTADGSMWYIQAVKSYFNHTRDLIFISQMLQTLKRIIENYRKGTKYERFNKDQIIRMDQKDGLIINPPQSTWMDADPSGEGRSITPRNGKTVEINALWYSNLRFLARILNLLNIDSEDARNYNQIADLVKKSFNEKFWNDHENALFDVIEGDPHQGAIRPNMIFAISHGGWLLPRERQVNVFNLIVKDLLTPGGLRTLSPRDSNYRGDYDTYLPPEHKDLSYHQGTVWPWLIGPYCNALVRILQYEGKNSKSIREEISQTLSPLVRFCMESPYRSLPEVFSGDPPHYPGGTTSQAWSVAEVFRILVEYRIVS